MNEHILFVDDETAVLDSMRRAFHARSEPWELEFLDSPFTAWQRLLEAEVDVLVCDVRMPGMSGLELLQRVQETEKTRNVPVVMVTGLHDRSLKRRSLDLGAADLLTKPIAPEDLRARIRSALRLKDFHTQLHKHNQVLLQTVQERTEQLTHSRAEIIWRLAKAAEYRDDDTGNHIVRVACYSRAIAEAMGMNRSFVEMLFLTAPLHDIGKIGIPDSILLKPGRLTSVEWEIMKQHCHIGADILREDSKARPLFQAWRGHDAQPESILVDPVLQTAWTIALTHHEKWNGSGYPQGMVGEAIPLEARIVAVSDTYDALRASRPYKPAFAEEKTMAIMRDGVDTHFDRQVFNAFERSLSEIQDIYHQFMDSVAFAEGVAV